MPDPFVFKKVLYLVEVTGRRARTLDELLRALSVVPAESVGYHMHREFLAYKFAPIEYPNDFAYWSAKVLGDDILAESLASLRVFKHRTLDGLRQELMRLIGEHLIEVPAASKLAAPPDREFHFLQARSVVMDCNRTARNLEELTGALAEVESSSLYFHLFETRFGGGRGRDNDFAEWIRSSMGDEDLAARVANVDPYMFSLEQVRRSLLKIFLERKAA
ncbi:MAG TPA: DUF5752 family protein [Polyangia bacterium]|nr:DUF5752 family protein [Polyangia bacterium]